MQHVIYTPDAEYETALVVDTLEAAKAVRAERMRNGVVREEMEIDDLDAFLYHTIKAADSSFHAARWLADHFEDETLYDLALVRHSARIVSSALIAECKRGERQLSEDSEGEDRWDDTTDRAVQVNHLADKAWENRLAIHGRRADGWEKWARADENEDS